jgi:hypothetical protein
MPGVSVGEISLDNAPSKVYLTFNKSPICYPQILVIQVFQLDLTSSLITPLQISNKLVG